MSLVLGIDIGGTKIAGGCVDLDGNIRDRITIPSGGALGKEAVMENLSGVIKQLLDLAGQSIAAIGIGTAGEVDPLTGIITSATDSIPNWTGTNLKKYCEQKYRLPTFVDNDGNAAALGELNYGAGEGLHNFIYLCLGTGVGGAVINEGNLLRGSRNYAGTLGHTSINFAGPACNCGSTGCLEMYVSGTAIGKNARQAHLGNDAKELYKRAAEGDVLAGKLVAEIGFYLGCGLANFCNQFDPEAIIVGGGVSNAGDWLLKPAKATLEGRVMQGLKNQVNILPARFGDDSVLVGAAVLAFNGLKER